MSKAVDIIIKRFLQDVEEKGVMPWQQPYKRQAPVNYFTQKQYRGINRFLLPFGEYATKIQVQQYNRSHKTTYKCTEGIHWYPVVYFAKQNKSVERAEVIKLFPGISLSNDGYLGNAKGWRYLKQGERFSKERNSLRFYWVADIKHFKDSNGNSLPSNLSAIELTKKAPQDIIDRYVSDSGVKMKYCGDIPCYVPALDAVHLNPNVISEDAWFSVAFHELAHSTGHRSRLAREGVVHSARGTEVYAVEECIAEMCACLLCAECGINEISTSCSMVYSNSVAYVQYWKQRIEDWGCKFVYVVAQAEEAYNCILGDL